MAVPRLSTAQPAANAVELTTTLELEITGPHPGPLEVVPGRPEAPQVAGPRPARQLDVLQHRVARPATRPREGAELAMPPIDDEQAET